MMTEHVHSPGELFLRLPEIAEKACKLARYIVEYLTLPMLGREYTQRRGYRRLGIRIRIRTRIRKLVDV